MSSDGMIPTWINVSLFLQQFRDPRPFFLETSYRAAVLRLLAVTKGATSSGFSSRQYPCQAAAACCRGSPNTSCISRFSSRALWWIPPHSQDGVLMWECSGPPGDGLVAIRHHFSESPDTSVEGGWIGTRPHR